MQSKEYRNKISSYLANNKDIFFYWKGRVALYALLKGMKISKGDEVILPGYTCVVVPNAIKYLGGIPIYLDVDKKTMNPLLESYQKAVTSNTKVIITQNTFGLSSEVDTIAKFARSNGIYTIEDWTHGFGGTYKGKPNGSYCDAAFFSTQWNKPFSSGIGGFSSINNKELIKPLQRVNETLINPSFKERLVLSALLFARDNILNESNYWRLRSLYRFLSKHNLVVGSSQGEELSGINQPSGYFKGISSIHLKKGNKNLESFEDLILRRKENADVYTQVLEKEGKYHVARVLHNDHSFLKYPVLVKDRQHFEQLAFEAKIELGDWFCSPLYPVKDKWELWELDKNTIPVAVWLAKHIVNLPTETNATQKVLDFITNNIHELI